MSSLYPSSMINMPDNPLVPVYTPKSQPNSPFEKSRRRREKVGMKVPISAMLKELWHCKLQQQCPVEAAGEISSWPPGQVQFQPLGFNLCASNMNLLFSSLGEPDLQEPTSTSIFIVRYTMPC